MRKRIEECRRGRNQENTTAKEAKIARGRQNQTKKGEVKTAQEVHKRLQETLQDMQDAPQELVYLDNPIKVQPPRPTSEDQKEETTLKPLSSLVINLTKIPDDPPLQTPSIVNQCLKQALTKLDKAQKMAKPTLIL